MGNALLAVLDAGDALIEAHGRVSIGWRRWVEANCAMSLRTANLYIQLACRRDEIEARLEDDPTLSLRAARRLISKPHDRQQGLIEDEREESAETSPEPSESVNLALAALDKVAPAEVTAVLNAKGLPWFLGVMPADWQPQLEQRILGLRIRAGHLGDPKLTRIVRTAMSHLAAASAPGISRPVQQSQEEAVLNALRALLRLDVDIHTLAVGVQTPRARKQRRA